MKTRLITFIFLVASSVAIAQPVRICDDDTEWPPYTYYPRVDGKPDKSRLTGAVVELLDEIFKINEMEYSIKLLPWKRCLNEVYRFGENRKFEVFTDGSFSVERTNKYYLSTMIYTTHQGVFYSKKKYPNGVPMQKSSDLNHFKLCGVHGWNYEYLYTDYGVAKDKKIDTGAKNIHHALTKISKLRCDVLPNSLEPVYGGVAVEKYTIPEDIASMPIPGVDPTTFHIFVSKSSPRAYELLTKINQAILILQHNGVSKKIFNKYFSER